MFSPAKHFWLPEISMNSVLKCSCSHMVCTEILYANLYARYRLWVQRHTSKTSIFVFCFLGWHIFNKYFLVVNFFNFHIILLIHPYYMHITWTLYTLRVHSHVRCVHHTLENRAAVKCQGSRCCKHMLGYSLYLFRPSS